MSDAPELLSIGRFAELTLLSAKALRLYDSQGILEPAETDPHSGYRYYRADQAGTGRVIGLFRAADVPLRTVAEILGAADSSTAAALIDDQIAQRRHRDAAAQLLLARARAHFFKEDTMTDVSTDLVAGQPVLSVLRHVTVDRLDAAIGDGIRDLRAEADRQSLQSTGAPFGIFHGMVTEDQSGPIEICLPVDQLAATGGEPRAYLLTGGRLAQVTVTGQETDFPAILAAYDTVASWIEEAGHRRVGPPRETWLSAPGDTPEMRVAWPYA